MGSVVVDGEFAAVDEERTRSVSSYQHGVGSKFNNIYILHCGSAEI